MTLSDYIQLLLERYNQPERSLFAMVAQVVHGCASPLEAWTALEVSHLLPANFVRSEQRHYADVTSIKSTDRPHEVTSPSTFQAVLTIASDLGGIGAAESYARELARSLSPWRAVCNDDVVWYFMERPIDSVVYLGLAYNSARDTVNWTLEEYGIELDSLEPSRDVCPLPLVVRNCLAAWQGWEIAVQKNFAIQRPTWPFNFEKWRLFSQLANPFESLLKLWCTGYLLYSDFSEADPTIRLYAQQAALPKHVY